MEPTAAEAAGGHACQRNGTEGAAPPRPTLLSVPPTPPACCSLPPCASSILLWRNSAPRGVRLSGGCTKRRLRLPGLEVLLAIEPVLPRRPRVCMGASVRADLRRQGVSGTTAAGTTAGLLLACGARRQGVYVVKLAEAPRLSTRRARVRPRECAVLWGVSPKRVLCAGGGGDWLAAGGLTWRGRVVLHGNVAHPQRAAHTSAGARGGAGQRWHECMGSLHSYADCFLPPAHNTSPRPMPADTPPPSRYPPLPPPGVGCISAHAAPLVRAHCLSSIEPSTSGRRPCHPSASAGRCGAGACIGVDRQATTTPRTTNLAWGRTLFARIGRPSGLWRPAASRWASLLGFGRRSTRCPWPTSRLLDCVCRACLTCGVMLNGLYEAVCPSPTRACVGSLVMRPTRHGRARRRAPTLGLCVRSSHRQRSRTHHTRLGHPSHAPWLLCVPRVWFCTGALHAHFFPVHKPFALAAPMTCTAPAAPRACTCRPSWPGCMTTLTSS